RHESLAAGAGDHHHAHLVVARELLENGRGGFPHVERHRIAPLGVVEGQRAHAALLVRQYLIGLAHRPRPCPCDCQSALALRNAAISFALKPNSRRIASVCSPRSGGGAASRLGVRDSPMGWPAMRSALPFFFTLCAMPRWVTWGSL